VELGPDVLAINTVAHLANILFFSGPSEAATAILQHRRSWFIHRTPFKYIVRLSSEKKATLGISRKKDVPIKMPRSILIFLWERVKVGINILTKLEIFNVGFWRRVQPTDATD